MIALVVVTIMPVVVMRVVCAGLEFVLMVAVAVTGIVLAVVVAVAVNTLMGVRGVIDTFVAVVFVDVVKFSMPASLDGFSS